jgi:ribosomal protein S18 acetylase RimI-like enzyme
LTAGRPAPGSIRPAAAGDGSAIARLWTEAYVTSRPGGPLEPYGESDYAASTAAGRVLVAEQGGRVVGVVVLYGPEADGRIAGREGEGELSRLAVSAGCRRAGVGGALLDRCEELGRAGEWSAIALWSRPWQTDAHRLYEARGYRRVPERDDLDAGGGRRLVFRLALG